MKVLYALEAIRTPLLDKLLGCLTYLGGEGVFILAAIVVFWAINKNCGYYMMTVGFAGLMINQFLKIYCRIPRPWVVDPDFTIVESAREAATGYSFPSGHTQTVFASLGAPARWFKATWFRIVCAALIVLTAFSRMYVGVHTPLDVGVSFGLGLILLFAVYPIFRDMDSKPRSVIIIFCIFILAAAAFVLFVELYTFPADTDEVNIAEAVKNAYMTLFCSLGLLLTFIVDSRYTRFETEAVWWAQLIKCGLGLAAALALKTFLKAPLLALFGGHCIAHGVCYFLVILFACVLWPMSFRFFSRLGKKA